MPGPASAYDAVIAAVLASPQGAMGAAEAAFANVIAGAVPRVARPPNGFAFAGNAAIRAELTNTRANWPVVIKHHLDDFVLPQYQQIPATAVAGVPGGAKVAWNTPARIDAITRKQADVAFTEPATNDFARATVARFDFKLRQLQENPGDDIANGWKLVKDYTTGGNVVPAAAYSARPAAVQAINNLAAFEGFCIRLASAIGAADRAGVSLAETLALWRTEGDLLTPYSELRRSAGAPACDVIPSISLGADTAEVFVSMQRGLWSFTYDRVIPTGLPADAVQKTHVEHAFRVYAFAHWSLVAAGLDFFWKMIPIDLNDRAAFVDALAQFLNANHVARAGGVGDFTASLKAACTAVLDDLACTLPTDSTKRAVVAPKTPSMLLSLIVSEALIFAELGTAAGNGPVVTPTAKLKYLSYHCQDHRHRTDAMQDKFTLMLVSAAVAAARGPAGALKTSLAPFAADPLFPKSSDLKSPVFNTAAVTGDTSGHLKAYQKLADAGWWTPTNVDNLADFMLVAKSDHWQGWDDLRGNMARYRKLGAYYEALFA